MLPRSGRVLLVVVNEVGGSVLAEIRGSSARFTPDPIGLDRRDGFAFPVRPNITTAKRGRSGRRLPR